MVTPMRSCRRLCDSSQESACLRIAGIDDVLPDQAARLVDIVAPDRVDQAHDRLLLRLFRAEEREQ